MRFSLLIVLFLSFAVVTNSMGQASLKFNQTFSAMQAKQLLVSIPADKTSFKSIKGSRVIVETLIEVATTNNRLLEFLAKDGRYDLQQKIIDNGETIQVFYQKPDNVLMMQGKQVEESVQYIIYVPEKMVVTQDTVSTL